MLDPKLIPTRLVESAEVRPIEIETPHKPSRWHLFFLLWVFGKFFATVLVLIILRRMTATEYARRLRSVFEHLGGLWIKLGQLLSLRTDVFSRTFCLELSRLQDTAKGFPPAMAREIIEQDLGGPLEAYFEYFEEMPFAAASIGQVHRAKLRSEGHWVAVKVQRPYAPDSFLREMSLIRMMVRFIEPLWFVPNLKWQEMLWELSQMLSEEIDYRYEAASTMRMRKLLRKHDVYVHQVFLDYSTSRVLVTEFITAVLMSDYIRVHKEDPLRCERWHQENDVKPKQVARRLFESLWRQLLEDNLFHGDLHPGNIVLLRDSKLALIDFGAVGTMEREYQQTYLLLMKALATKDYAKAADCLFLISGALPPTDLTEVKQKLIRALRGWELRSYIKKLAYHQKSMSSLANELIRILFQYECPADWSFLRITRAQETLDQSLLHLIPQANYTKLMGQYFEKAEARERSRAISGKSLVEYGEDLLTLLRLPRRLNENATFEGWILRRQAQTFRGSTSKVSQFFATLFGRAAYLLFAFEIYFFLVFLQQHHTSWVPSLARRVLGEELDAFPGLTYVSWLVILLLGFLICQTLFAMKRGFSRTERAPLNSA